MTMPHTLQDCPQNPVLANMAAALKRLDAQGERAAERAERTAVALESIAAQGAILGSHEKRLDKHDQDFREMFNRINDRREMEKLSADLESVKAAVVALEKAHAKEDGAEIVEAKVQARIDADAAEDKKFWTELKIKLITPVMFTLFFSLWLIDKWGLVLKFKTLISEFKG